MSKWLTHLKKFYLDKKKTDKSYSYKNAMKDAVFLTYKTTSLIMIYIQINLFWNEQE